MTLIEGLRSAEPERDRLPMRQASFDGLAICRAGIGDAQAVAAQFHSTYGNSDHPFGTVEDVSRLLADLKNFLIVAKHDGQIVSSMAMTYCAWNDSYELGRALTHPDHRRRGLAALLIQQVVDLVCREARGEVFFGSSRARRTVDLCSQLKPAMIVAGHNGGRSVANGSRETHVIVYSIPRHARFSHVTPLVDEIRESRYLREYIYEPLGLRQSPGEYPPQWFVGELTNEAVAFEDFIIEHCPGSPNRAVDIVGECGRKGQAVRLRRTLDALLRILPAVEHITATILADKIGLIHELHDFGFKTVAYLPAWYKLERSRFDCVQMVRRSYTEPAPAPGMEQLLAGLEIDLASCLAPRSSHTYA